MIIRNPDMMVQSAGVRTQRYPHWVTPFSLPTPSPPPLFSSGANSVPLTDTVKIRLKTMITRTSLWEPAKELALANQYLGRHITLSCTEGISERIARSLMNSGTINYCWFPETRLVKTCQLELFLAYIKYILSLRNISSLQIDNKRRQKRCFNG